MNDIEILVDGYQLSGSAKSELRGIYISDCVTYLAHRISNDVSLALQALKENGFVAIKNNGARYPHQVLTVQLMPKGARLCELTQPDLVTYKKKHINKNTQRESEGA